MNGRTEKGSFYRSIFQTSTVGQIIVSEDLRLVAANRRMFEYFRLKPYDAKDGLFGCVFHCAHREKICGQNDKCQNCYIRSAVNDIISNRIAVMDSVMQYQFIIESRRRTKWFQLSGKLIQDENKQYALLAFADITELKLQEEQLRKNLELDLATGTMNKYSLMSSLQKLIEPSTSGGGFTMVMIDFDNFKEINDQYGHLIGDKVLETFSDIARRHIRKKDILGRYGGEEFIFIFPHVDQRQALRILKRIHKELCMHFAKTLTLPVTFSAGIIYVDHDEHNLPLCSDLIGNVDRMLYRAKEGGRNRAVYDKGEMVFWVNG
jgi:diguanylate cyclase (GGDEF)-like protein